MAKKQKYYVVWAGVKPGIYPDWGDAKAQIDGFEGAKYKSFESRDEAEKAFRGSYTQYYNFAKKTDPSVKSSFSQTKPAGRQAIIHDSICVDAACSGNPGLMTSRFGLGKG